MSPQFWSAVFLLLSTGCDAGKSVGNISAAADQGTNSAQVPGVSDAEADLYYPPENYLRYPAGVRDLIRRSEMENDHCRGFDPDIREIYRACNRRLTLHIELERRGWCWGQRAVKLHISANNHWLPCSEDPTYRPGRIENETYFSEEEINDLAEP